MLSNLIFRLAEGVSWRVSLYLSVFRALARRPLLRRARFVAITGSAGKTTTKDIAALLLSSLGSCNGNYRSFNNPEAVARFLSRVPRSSRHVVVEVSGGKPNALDWPLRLFKPDIAVVTLVQREHAAPGFGLAEIAKEKWRLVTALRSSGVAVLNRDDELLRELGAGFEGNVFWVGTGEGVDLRLVECRSNWPEPLFMTVEYKGAHHEIGTQLHGTHLALSVMSGVAVALLSGMKIGQAAALLREAKPSSGRMEVVTSSDGVSFVRDDWKAPLWSFEAPLDFMRAARAERKVLVIGTLSDYSLSASKLYPRIAARALDIGDLVVFVGPHSLRAVKGVVEEDRERIRAFPDIGEAGRFLRSELRTGDLVLLKGSGKVDHLVRLYLDRVQNITCWRSRCGREFSCIGCDKLHEPHSVETNEVSSAPSSDKVLVESLQKYAGAVGQLVVGLGNASESLINTRHNVGHLALDHLARVHRGAWQLGSLGHYCLIDVGASKVLLCKPFLAINRSGVVVRQLLAELGLGTESVMLIHDDLDLKLGDFRLKQDGGDGGHRGVQSVLKAVQSGKIRRIRIGVRGDGEGQKAKELVHREFSQAEHERLQVAFNAIIGHLV